MTKMTKNDPFPLVRFSVFLDWHANVTYISTLLPTQKVSTFWFAILACRGISVTYIWACPWMRGTTVTLVETGYQRSFTLCQKGLKNIPEICLWDFCFLQREKHFIDKKKLLSVKEGALFSIFHVIQKIEAKIMRYRTVLIFV